MWSGPAELSAPSAGGRERPRRGKHEGTDLVQISLTQESDRRAVLELRVQPLESGLHHLGAVSLADQHRDLVGQAQSLLVGLILYHPGALRPLAHGTGLPHSP